MRAFVGLPVPEDVVARVEEVRRVLRRIAEQRGVALRWALPEQLHVTLKFLGRVSAAQAAAMATAVARHGDVEPVAARLVTVGVFGSERRATVLHASVLEPAGRIAALAAAFEEVAVGLGVPREERSFVPHVTLARFRHPADAREIVASAPVLDVPVVFTRIRLYESRTTPDGGRYSVLAEAPLRGE